MRLAALAAFAVLLAAPAWACDPAASGSEFQLGAAGWGESDAQFSVAGAEATLKPEVGTQTARWNAGKPLGSLDACVTIAMPDSTSDASRGYAGLLFWVIDKDNFHQAVISRNGMVSVARKVNGRILAASPVNWVPASVVNATPNAKNALRVTLEGQNVIVRVNDTEVARFRGQAPEAPSHVGLVASSAPSAVDTWRMSDLKVAEIAAAVSSDATGAIATPPESNCGTGAVLFEDKFAGHDPMWGGKTSEVTMGGGQAEFDPAPGTPALRWNRAFVFGDIDACATVQLAKPTVDPTASYAGLLFWVQDSRNYYQAVLAPNGYFTVARITDGKVVAKRPVAWSKQAAIKTGAKEFNTLRVTAKGPEAQVFVNGQQVARFRGEPPNGASYIGLLASSAQSKAGDTWSIKDLKITAPQ
jgi:hypothetical protein